MNSLPKYALVTFALLLALVAKAETPTADPMVTYVVRSGDKLINIASKVLADPDQWAEVAQLNRMANPNEIAVDQRIQIPLRLMRWTPSPARLVSANGDIQINGAPVAAGARLVEGDRLQSGASSSAVVEMKDGTRIQILPKSLMELVKHRQYGHKDEEVKTNWFASLLRLTQGAVEAIVTPGVQRAAPLQVTTPTSVVGVRGTRFRVAYDARARSEVIEGLVAAENPAQGTIAELPAGTGAVIRPEEKTIEVKQLLSAPDLSALPARVESRGAWQWPIASGAQAWRVQLATDAQFNQIVFEDKFDLPSWSMAGLPLGQWFARVRAVDNVGLEGFDSARAIEIVATPPPAWTLQTSALTFRDGVSRLKWTPVESQSKTGGEWRADILKNGVAIASRSIYSGGGSLTEFLELTPGAYTVQVQGTDAQGTPFPRTTFRLQVPDGWGSSISELANPLQLIE